MVSEMPEYKSIAIKKICAVFVRALQKYKKENREKMSSLISDF